MKQCKWFSICPMNRFYQQGKIDKFWIENYCLVGNHECVRYQQEEKGIPHPDHMMPDGSLNPDLK